MITNYSQKERAYDYLISNSIFHNPIYRLETSTDDLADLSFATVIYHHPQSLTHYLIHMARECISILPAIVLAFLSV